MDEVTKYTKNYMLVLLSCCLKFRKMIKDYTLTQIWQRNGTFKEKFVDCSSYITVSSFSMGIYKFPWLEEEHEVKLKDGSTVSGIYKAGQLKLKVEGQLIDSSYFDKEKDTFIKTGLNHYPAGGLNRDNFSKQCIEWLTYLNKKGADPLICMPKILQMRNIK